MSITIRATSNGNYIVEKDGAIEGRNGRKNNPQCGWFGEHKGRGLYRSVGPAPSLLADEMEIILNFMRTIWPRKEGEQQ